MNDSIALLGKKILQHKYWFVTCIFLLIVCLLDEHNVFKHIQNQREISALKSEKEMYQKDYDDSTEKLEKMEADPELIEKVARERYRMHTEQEDVFIVDD